MRYMFTVPMICLSSLLCLGSIGIQLSPEDQQKLEERYAPPARDTLQPMYSLDPAERDMLLEHLTKVQRAYEVMQFRAKMEHMGIDSAYLAWNSLLVMDSMRDKVKDRRAIEDIKAPLFPEHAYWLMTVSQGAFEEVPRDWRVIETVLRIGLRVERQIWLDRLAREVIAVPLSDQPEKYSMRAIEIALYYLRDHWATDSARTIAFVFTLPYQPREREIFPVAENESRPKDSEEWLSKRVYNLMSKMRLYPERSKEIMHYIDIIVTEGNITLSEEESTKLNDYTRLMAHYYPDDPYWTEIAASR